MPSSRRVPAGHVCRHQACGGVCQHEKSADTSRQRPGMAPKSSHPCARPPLISPCFVRPPFVSPPRVTPAPTCQRIVRTLQERAVLLQEARRPVVVPQHLGQRPLGVVGNRSKGANRVEGLHRRALAGGREALSTSAHWLWADRRQRRWLG